MDMPDEHSGRALGLIHSVWVEHAKQRSDFQLALQEGMRRAMHAEAAARERILREFVVGPAIPVARTEAETWDGMSALAEQRPWGVVLDDGSIAWFRSDRFLGWNTHKQWAVFSDDND